MHAKSVNFGNYCSASFAAQVVLQKDDSESQQLALRAVLSLAMWCHARFENLLPLNYLEHFWDTVL